MKLYLQPLSLQHYRMLLFCDALKAELCHSPMDRARVAEKIRKAWKSLFDRHFREEEALLLPQLERIDGSAHAERLVHDHDTLRRFFTVVGEPGIVSPAFLQHLIKETEIHIFFEERVVFPFIENATGKDMLAYIGSRLADS